MSTIYVTDANTGQLVEIDTENPTGSLSVVNANTGEIVTIDLSSPSGTIHIVDADTGEIVELDYANLTGVIHVIDANTGEIVEVDFDNPSGSIYLNDENTGELVQIDISSSLFVNANGVYLIGESDSVAPTVAITLSQYTFKIGETATVTFTFSEEVLNFTVADVTAQSGSISSFTATGNPLVYTAAFTPSVDTEDATNMITVGTSWTDLNGNAPTGSTNSSNYTVDTLAPTVAITLSQYTFKSGDTATVTFTFSEAPTNFTSADITTQNGTLSSFGVTGNPLVYTATFTPASSTEDATNIITVGTNWQDAAGNSPTGSTNSSNYTVDTTRPTCTVTASAATITTAAFTATFTFSEAVTGFVLGDITVANGSAGTFNTVSTSVYTAVITPTATGTVTVNVADGACTDAAGNANTASNTFSILYVAALLWLKADAGVFTDDTATTPATVDGSVVAVWQDQSGNAKHFIQTDNTKRPSYQTAEKNSLPVIRGDGGNDVLGNTNLSASSGSFTFYMVGKPTVQGDDMIFDAQTGRLIVTTNGPNSKLGFYDGSWKEVNSATEAAYQVVSWVLTSGGNGEIFKNGSSQGTAAYAAKAIGGSIGLFGAYTQAAGGSYIPLDMGEFFVFSGAHSPTVRAAIESYLSTKWAISF